MFKIPSLNSTPMIQRIKFPLVFVFFLFLNILAYHNALHHDIRYDQLNVYSGAQIPHFSDRVKYAFFQHGPDGPIMQPELTWFRPIPLLISWELFRVFGGQWHMINMVNILIITPLRLLFLIVLVGTTIEVLTQRTREQSRERAWRKKVQHHSVVIGSVRSAKTTIG